LIQKHAAAFRFKRFDVRPLLKRGAEPLPDILKRVQALKPNDGLIILAPFLPSPLIELLAARASPRRSSAARVAVGLFTSGTSRTKSGPA
jgi:hypothetical protein